MERSRICRQEIPGSQDTQASVSFVPTSSEAERRLPRSSQNDDGRIVTNEGRKATSATALAFKAEEVPPTREPKLGE
jgi:hypothetical protein